ncbi:MAG: tRNA glutamyl-Q(34) synthetase GluQRS [Terracidiphilus sp.]|jgi:glutamyl-tRNA synthetase
MKSISPSQPPGYRGRLAPSPTGYLHLGHARTFWTAFERARDAGGTLVMRMEDLDPERSRAEYAQAALDDLRWLGIRWQEGPDVGGPYAPYAQSGRRAIYLDAWRKLLRGEFVYPCRCSRKDLEAALSAPHEGDAQEPLDDEPIYPGTCRPGSNCISLPNPTTDEVEEPDCFNWRFRVPDGEAVEFEDLNLGPQQFVAGRDFGDFAVWRRDGVPSYQLACVADDAAMKITEVVRGEDLLKSTARQILLNRALGFENPAWFHCRMTLDENGRRLAKRHDALSLRTLRLRGVKPAEILAWKPQRNSNPLRPSLTCAE